MLIFVCFFLQVFALIYGQKLPIVDTISGKIQGFHANSSNGACFRAFLNIPFAIPPVGHLRFTYPQPFGNWTGIRFENESGNACSQMAFGTDRFIGNEDCLNLNVYVPQCESNFANEALPVMVYFHGGGFIYGSNRYAEYDPKKFMDFPVILVIPNYRLGVFGFLSTNDSSAYGNYALMDAILALKWVQKNIQSFGGDPKRVTIFGNSAGSATVVHLVLSQLSKDLIKPSIKYYGSKDYFRKQFVSQLPLFSLVQPHMTDAIEAIENYYNITDLDLNNETLFVQVYSKILGDAVVSASNSLTADLLSQAGLPVHAFIYSHIGTNCLAFIFGEKCGLYSSHADELFLQFVYFKFSNDTDSDKQMTAILNGLWTTFANHSYMYLSSGVPWPLYNTTNPKHAILNPQPTIASGTLSNATDFWTVTIPNLIKKYI